MLTHMLLSCPTTVWIRCHCCKLVVRKKLLKSVPCSRIEFPVRLPNFFLESSPGYVEEGEAGGSTTLFQGQLCINQVNSGGAASVGWNSCGPRPGISEYIYLQSLCYFFSKDIVLIKEWREAQHGLSIKPLADGVLGESGYITALLRYAALQYCDTLQCSTLQWSLICRNALQCIAF